MARIQNGQHEYEIIAVSFVPSSALYLAFKNYMVQTENFSKSKAIKMLIEQALVNADYLLPESQLPVTVLPVTVLPDTSK